jgi:hypothetical protein
MPKEFAKFVLAMSNADQALVAEAIERLELDINYMEYAKRTFNSAAKTQESIRESKQLLQKLRDLQKPT